MTRKCSYINLYGDFLLHNCQSPELTALMITHHMEDALKYGNRLIVMKEGRIIQDLKQEEKAKMKISDYYQLFE